MKNQPLPSEQSGVPIWTWVGLHALPPQLLGMNEVALDKEWWFGLIKGQQLAYKCPSHDQQVEVRFHF